ncbi:MAG: DUF456 domain-containing protein [Bacteroidales bacterium]|nr:DUF456 domain-containing protein [Bacteroidales bacterium]MCF8345492.1 DUF456 domain-containing protein [Bacteroidales bacterium]MCF8351175.1 DUF456 domain-containing protein [Bacteroidales bacterium]MCF8377695.1 DUF456 domain-containing protein [Bacteroidales bacterium]
MDWLLFTIAFIVVFIGIIGAVLPVIPGQIVAYLSLLIIQASDMADRYSASPYNADFLVVMAVICILVTILDYVVPIYGTKRFGGSKAGVWGSTIGLVIGIIVLPMAGILIGPFGILGIILGPFLGAYIGESTTGKDSRQAFRAAMGSFIGFLAGTFMKLVYGFVSLYYLVKGAFFM